MTRTTSLPATAVPLAWMAAATALCYLVALAVLHVLRTDVDPATDPVSDYAVGAYGTLHVLATLAVGLGALALTAALSQTPPRSTAGLVLLGVFGLAKVVQAFFPIDVGDAATTSGTLHNLLGNVAFFVLPVAAVVLSRWRGRIELAIAVLLAVATVAVLASETVGGYGIAQRSYLILSSIWVLVTAVRLAPRQPEPTAGTQPATRAT
jgi:Protein of unknown function (DUF998)